MTHVSFVTELKSILPESSWPWMFAALKHDPLIWDCLSGEIGDRLLDLKSTNPEDYSPAAISLMTLELPTTADQLRLAPLDAAVNGEVDEWEVILADIPLAQAGLLALEMRERYNTAGSWANVIKESHSLTPTGLACLYGIISEPVDLLRSILNFGQVENKGSINTELAMHALLSNPITPREQLSMLISLVDGMSSSQQLEILKLLSPYRPELAAKLSGRIRDHSAILAGRHQSKTEVLAARLASQIRNAEYSSLEGDTEQSIASLEESITTTRLLEARLAANVAENASLNAENGTALSFWERAYELNPESPDIRAGYAITLAQENRIADAQARLGTPQANQPTLLLAAAKLNLQRGDYDNARQFASDALGSFDHEALQDNLYPRNFASQLARILLELNLPRQAMQAAEYAVSQKPNDPDMLTLLCCTRSAAAQAEAALLAAHLAVSASPDRQDLQLNLAESFEINGDWTAALNQRSRIIETHDAPPESDLLSLARCAIFAGQPESATEVCQHLLQHDENNAEAMVILGKAKAILGDSQGALEYLHQGTQFLPDQPTAWLALAEFYMEQDQKQKALETLQAASHAAPESPDIHLALGEALFDLGKLTQALTSLQIAIELIRSKTAPFESPLEASGHGNLYFQISLRLGQTLHKLGHLDDSRTVLADAYQQVPAYPELAQSYAEALLDSGEIDQAIAPLETILATGPEDITPYLKYAQCLLALFDLGDEEIEMERAIPVLERALEINPSHPEGMILYAEALAANDELLSAMDAYNKALDSGLANDPEWQVRLSLGFGQLALKMDQVETALASLQEAYQSDPENTRVLRSLSEAYSAAGLNEDAYQTAQTVLRLTPDDVDSLIWFVNQVESLLAKPGFNIKEAQAEILNVLSMATQLEPHRTDLWLRLGQVHQKSGDDQAAITAYRTIADIHHSDSPCPAADLYQAALELMELGDAESSVTCLERALQPDYTPISPSDPSLLEILTALSMANFQKGDPRAALETLDQAIEIAPDEPSLYIDKADLLLESGITGSSGIKDFSEALSCLDKALELNPNDPESQHRAALIRRTAGDIPTALAHAEQLIKLSSDSLDQNLTSRTLAAELALSMLQPDLALSYLDHDEPEMEGDEHLSHLDYHCLLAELALDEGEDHIAVNQLVKILETAPEDARVMAIQARLSIKRGDYHAANASFKTAFAAIGDLTKAQLTGLRLLAETALETRQWDRSIEILRHIIDIAPKEPASHLFLARVLVLRAEYERLCQSLEAVHRTPGEASMDEDSHREFPPNFRSVL